MKRAKVSAARGARVICLKPPKPEGSTGRGLCDVTGCMKEWEFVWHLRAGGTSKPIKRRCQDHFDDA